MATGIVVGGILLAADQELGVEELAVVASPDLVDRGGVEVDEDGARDVFAAAGLGKEGLEGASIAGSVLGTRIRAAVDSEAMLEEVPGATR